MYSTQSPFKNRESSPITVEYEATGRSVPLYDAIGTSAVLIKTAAGFPHHTEGATIGHPRLLVQKKLAATTPTPWVEQVKTCTILQ